MVSRVVVLNDAGLARGGATGLALLSIRQLRARAIPVTFIVGGQQVDDELSAIGVEVVALGGRPLVEDELLHAASRGVYDRRARAMIARWIAERDAPGTVYHVHGWSKILSPSVFSALRPVASRTVVHAHDFFLACPNGAFMDYRRSEPCERRPLGPSCLATNCDKRSYAQKLWRAGRHAALLRTLDKAAPWAALFMVHERMAHHLIRVGFPAALLRTLRNPVAPFVEERIRAEENSAFFYVGRVEAEKGVTDAIAAAQAANVRLEVVGEGPLRSELERRHPAVRFHGWRSRAELARLVRAARAVVMPSRYPEPFGLVAAEASLSGLPVILSRLAFLADDVLAHGIGASCDTSDVGAFAAEIARLRDMSREQIRAESERAFSGEARLGMTEGRWTDELLATYGAAVASARST